MPMPSLCGDLNNREQDAECGQKPLGAFPVLLVFFHAMLQGRDAASVSVTD